MVVKFITWSIGYKTPRQDCDSAKVRKKKKHHSELDVITDKTFYLPFGEQTSPILSLQKNSSIH